MKIINVFVILAFLHCTQKQQTQLNPDTIIKLKSKLTHKNKFAKIEAAEEIASLGEIAHPLIPELEKNLNHPDNDVKIYTTFAVGKIGPKAEKLIPLLIENLKVDIFDVCQKSVWALNNMRSLQASEAFLKYLKDLVLLLEDPENIQNRIIAAKRFGCLGKHGELYVSVLGERLLYDSSPLVRIEAARSLGIIGSGDATPYLKASQLLWVGDFALLTPIDPIIFFRLNEVNFYVYAITKNGIEIILDKPTKNSDLKKILKEKAFISKLFVPKKNIYRKNIHKKYVPVFSNTKKDIGKTNLLYISSIETSDYTEVPLNLFPELIKPYFMDQEGTYLEKADFVREEAKRAIELIEKNN